MHSEHSNQNSKKIPFLQELGEIRIVSNGNREVIVENLRKILGYSDNEIIISDGKKRIYIRGTNLQIVCFGCFDAKIIGTICSLEWVMNWIKPRIFLQNTVTVVLRQKAVTQNVFWIYVFPIIFYYSIQKKKQTYSAQRFVLFGSQNWRIWRVRLPFQLHFQSDADCLMIFCFTNFGLLFGLCLFWRHYTFG